MGAWYFPGPLPARNWGFSQRESGIYPIGVLLLSRDIAGVSHASVGNNSKTQTPRINHQGAIAMNTNAKWAPAAIVRTVLVVVVGCATMFSGKPAEATHSSFAPGDVFVALRSGQVLWYHPDGTLNKTLTGVIQGKVEGLGHDASGNLYVSHYCADLSVCQTGNAFEKFNTLGISQGQFGSDYCIPFSILFDGSGRAYVGQSECDGILELNADGVLQRSFAAEAENQGAVWIELANDGCTMFYTSRGQKVKRFNICTNEQLADFYTFPGAATLNQLRVLPNGDILVAADTQILRINPFGTVVQVYDVATEFELWYGVALVGDGTFWASNYGTSNVYRFDIDTGGILDSFNTGTPTTTVKGLAVMPDDGGSVSSGEGTRYDEDSSSVAYSCPSDSQWHTVTRDSLYSGGSATSSMDAACRASFSFTGTGIDWIGYSDEWSGIADVYLDGGLVATVDTYASPAQSQVVLYSARGLASDIHTLEIEVTGNRSAASGGDWITVDAFDVAP